MLSSLFGRFRRLAPFLPPTPDTPICVIGDVHGCFVQLEKLLTKVPQDHRIILVGDYVDRGEYSAEVLRLISARPDITCLKGNHEEMMLRFLNDPLEQGPRWLRYGGLQTWEMSGNVLVVHAGADPNVPPTEQSEKTLIWGHPSFLKTIRRDGVWVVHGHTIVGVAGANKGRISIDTGAFATGVLSAVCLDGGEPRFLTAQG